MDLLAEYGLFFLQTMTVVVAVILVIAVSSKLSGGDEAKGTIKVTDLSKKIADQKKYVSAIVETALNNDQPSFLEPVFSCSAVDQCTMVMVKCLMALTRLRRVCLMLSVMHLHLKSSRLISISVVKWHPCESS